MSKKFLIIIVTLLGKIFKMRLMNRKYLGMLISFLFLRTPSMMATAALLAGIDPKKPGNLNLMSFLKFSVTMNG